MSSYATPEFLLKIEKERARVEKEEARLAAALKRSAQRRKRIDESPDFSPEMQRAMSWSATHLSRAVFDAAFAIENWEEDYRSFCDAQAKPDFKVKTRSD